jgi:hypothetical protein
MVFAELAERSETVLINIDMSNSVPMAMSFPLVGNPSARKRKILDKPE